MTGDGEPGGGVELMMQKHLVGTPGQADLRAGPRRHGHPGRPELAGPGGRRQRRHLTINSTCSGSPRTPWRRVKETKALSGTVVIEDVKTGNLLAVASYPSFDPNTDVGKKGAQLSNVAFSDVFEPGSTVKIMTMAAALEEGTVTPSTPVVDPQPPAALRRELQGQPRAPHRVPHVAGTLAQSSNIGTILVGETLKPKTLSRYFRKFGLGRESGIGLPRRVPRPARRRRDWSGSKQATVVFGQGISVNAIQAAGGVPDHRQRRRAGRAPPRRQRHRAPTAPSSPTPTSAKRRGWCRTRPPPTSSADARGRRQPGRHRAEAQIPGYRVAGKTGTADYYDAKAGGYSGRHRDLHRLRPRRRPAARRGGHHPEADLRRYFGGVRRRPGVQGRHDLRAAGAEDPADRHEAAEGHPARSRPQEALADPTVLRNGHKRSDR